jgi:phosphatidylserine decarboxylase
MADKRRGEATGAPHEILDPRDLKYCANQCTAHWLPKDDPFQWRDDLPVVRWGLAELQLVGWPLAVLTIALGASDPPWRWAAAIPLVLLAWWISFFRNPRRRIPEATDVFVAPADGKIKDVVEMDHYDFFDGPAVRIGIFLSIFNVHINRSPRSARVLAMHYQPGEFLDARNPESAVRNEFMWIGFEDAECSLTKGGPVLAPPLNFAVRQVSGLLARRIVCALRPGQAVSRGEKFGMIKLGSRTELILPRNRVIVEAAVGDVVKAGVTVLARTIPTRSE